VSQATSSLVIRSLALPSTITELIRANPCSSNRVLQPSWRTRRGHVRRTVGDGDAGREVQVVGDHASRAVVADALGHVSAHQTLSAHEIGP